MRLSVSIAAKIFSTTRAVKIENMKNSQKKLEKKKKQTSNKSYFISSNTWH
jgi:hypothetical protein